MTYNIDYMYALPMRSMLLYTKQYPILEILKIKLDDYHGSNSDTCKRNNVGDRKSSGCILGRRSSSEDTSEGRGWARLGSRVRLRVVTPLLLGLVPRAIDDYSLATQEATLLFITAGGVEAAKPASSLWQRGQLVSLGGVERPIAAKGLQVDVFTGRDGLAHEYAGEDLERRLGLVSVDGVAGLVDAAEGEVAKLADLTTHIVLVDDNWRVSGRGELLCIVTASLGSDGERNSLTTEPVANIVAITIHHADADAALEEVSQTLDVASAGQVASLREDVKDSIAGEGGVVDGRSNSQLNLALVQVLEEVQRWARILDRGGQVVGTSVHGVVCIRRVPAGLCGVVAKLVDLGILALVFRVVLLSEFLTLL